MLKRTLMMAMVCLAFGAQARGTNLNAQLFPLTGEVRFREVNGAAVQFVYYSITSGSSTSGALNSSGSIWKSITDNYDASGNGFIDATHEWAKLSTTSTELTEGVFLGPGGSLPALRSLSLGNIWNTNVVPWTDLAFSVEADTQSVAVNVVRALDGDYDASGTVDQADYDSRRQYFGSTSNLDADGNLNGIVDAPDYVIWRDNFGLSLPGAGSLVQGNGGGSLLQLGAAVPEPTSILLLLSAAGTLLTARVRAPRVARRAAGRCSVRR